MKITLLSALMVLLGIADAHAQNYSIEWYTIDGGGGTSKAETFIVSGTIGQPDASLDSMNGGFYSVTGGFWSLIVVQTPGAPRLRIVRTGPDQVTLSWEPNTHGWVLQESSTLSSADWVDAQSNADNPVTLPIPESRRFYRLSKP